MTDPRAGQVGRKLAVLGGLYAAQGLPFGFFTQALPVMLRELDTSLTMIGAASVLGAPWALKALWAPVVERSLTLRRWILTLQALTMAGALAMAWLDPANGIVALSVGVFAMNLFAATQDIATDGLAVASLASSERGWGNGLQVAGYRVGMVLGGAVLLGVFGRAGWAVTLGLMAAALGVATLPLALTPHMGGSRPSAEARTGFAWDWLAQPGTASWVAVLVAFKLGDYLVGGMLRPWLVDLGITTDAIAVMLGGAGFTAGLVGAVVGGLMVQPLGRVRSLIVFGVLEAFALSTFAVVSAAGWTGSGLWTAVLVEHFLGGCATAALFTAMMDASREEHGATDYTLQASLVVVASLVGAGVSGMIADAVGYTGLFALGGAMAFAAPALASVPACTAWMRREGAR